MATREFDVIVLGGGAAGLMCAIEAGKRGKRVAVLERAARIGKKILISGGAAAISQTFIAGQRTSSRQIHISPSRHSRLMLPPISFN